MPDTERRTTYAPGAPTIGPFNVAFDIYADGNDYQNWVEVWLNGVKLIPITDWVLDRIAFDTMTGTLADSVRPIQDARIKFTVARQGTMQIVGARRPRRTSQLDESTGVTARDQNQFVTDLWATGREIWDRLNRAVFAPFGEAMKPLPSAATRASQLFGFDTNGDPMVVGSTTAAVTAAALAAQAAAEAAAAAAQHSAVLASSPAPYEEVLAYAIIGRAQAAHLFAR